jgi:uncharacterized protein
MSKRILITGGSGFIGSQLVAGWLADGHEVVVLTRQPQRLQQRLPGVQTIAALDEAAGYFQWLINLAGEGIADQRWSPARKAVLRDSRIALTEALVAWAVRTRQSFEVVLSGSAIGYYGSARGVAGQARLTEDSPAGQDFAATLCRDWEQSVSSLQDMTERLVLLRTGVVLGNGGGMLGRLWLPFKMGMGGRIGDGSQYLSWIHISDYCRAVNALLDNSLALSGAINMTSPEAVTNAEFTRQLARALSRPALLPMPELVTRLLFGEMSVLLLEGQRVQPAQLQNAGFGWHYPSLQSALAEIVAVGMAGKKI